MVKRKQWISQDKEQNSEQETNVLFMEIVWIACGVHHSYRTSLTDSGIFDVYIESVSLYES